MSRFVLDCAAERPVDDLAAQWVSTAVQRAWARPTAAYHEGRTSRALLDQSAATVAGLLSAGGARFTPDVPSALRVALAETVREGRCTTVATSEIDSQALQEACAQTAGAAGVALIVLPVDARGRLQEQDLAALGPPAVLATGLVNQEIGVVQTAAAQWAERSGCRLVLEASAGFGWVDLPSDWTRLVLDPRAWGSPAGAAVLATPGARPADTFDNVAAAVTAGLTAQRWAQQAPAARSQVAAQAARIAARVPERLSGVQIHGTGPGHAPHIVSISVLYVDAEVVQTRLDARGYAVGSGSACASRTGEPSHVLAAIGGLTSGNIRLGLPPDLPDAAVDGFIDALVDVVGEVRREMGTADL